MCVFLVFPFFYFTRFNTNDVCEKFLPEVWTLYSIGIAILLLRFATRLKTVGLRGFQGDDYMSILTVTFYTAGVAAVDIICKRESKNPS